MFQASGLVAPVVGGVLVGTSASLLWLDRGRVAGISSMLGSLPGARDDEAAWRLAFLAGVLISGAVATLAWPESMASGLQRPPAVLFGAGLLVGFGTRLGSGCTSGHGVCGLSRGSGRSLAAVLTFIGVGMATTALARGWWPS
jgi:uncharacterized membrane protein YedE/YeeE